MTDNISISLSLQDVFRVSSPSPPLLGPRAPAPAGRKGSCWSSAELQSSAPQSEEHRERIDWLAFRENKDKYAALKWQGEWEPVVVEGNAWLIEIEMIEMWLNYCMYSGNYGQCIVISGVEYEENVKVLFPEDWKSVNATLLLVNAMWRQL